MPKFSEHLEDLKQLARIPSVSFPGFDPKEVERSAQAVAALLKKRGLENIEILKIDDAHPYVVADWLHAGPGAPTVLLYAHHDVQPPGRTELWKTPPFEPTEKQGPGGLRLYGRGTADDKAGVIVHSAAISNLLEKHGKLPLNVKIVIEGEEEVGSTHLEAFLMRYRERLQADVLILTDTSNFDCGVPALTTALRGLVEVQVEVRALTKSIHSGMWGGPIPDPVMALSKMLATLVDEKGRIAIPGVLEQVRPVSSVEAEAIARVPYDEKNFREASGMVPSAQILKEGPHVIAQTWRYPSLTVNAIEASSRKAAANIINDTAWAKVTIRLVPDMDPRKVQAALEAQLKKTCPWGLEVKIDADVNGSTAWSIEPQGPAFDAAIAAMKEGYGVAPVIMGCGGSIPFVKPFAAALGGAPALLIGVEDPHTNAHGENESLLISDLEKACKSQELLFEKLAASWKGKR